jgi:hypothetical protein
MSKAQKSLTDAGYIVIGLGVMGYQQAQIRARAAQKRAGVAGTYVADRARGVRGTVDNQAQTARAQAETQVRNTVARAGVLRDEVGKRVEPVVGQAKSQLGELPERVVQAMEPVAARVREISGSSA